MVVRPKVLYVDAEEANLAVFRHGFASQYDVATSASGTNCLNGDEFTVVIADRPEVLGEAKKLQPDAVTMMVTANPSFESAVEAINQGRVVRYLRKPWSRGEMLQALRDGVGLFEKRRENRLLRDRLIAEERHVVIGQLASGLVHELANIGAVLAVVENVREDWNRGIDLKEELDTLRMGVEKYFALVGSLKFCGSGQNAPQLTLEQGDVRHAMREAFEIANHFPSVRRLVKADLVPGPPIDALIDKSALFHALLNLLKNGAEASPFGKGELTLRANREGSQMRIEIIDNGPGVPEAIATKIFEGFYSTKGASGTGLGLLVTRRIVEGHGGKLEFRNLPSGCVFSIVIDAVPA